MIFINFREIAYNRPLFGEALFRTLIADGKSPFSASFSPLLADLFLVRNVDRSYSRLAPPKGPFLETNELPMLFIKFRKIADNLPLFGEAIFPNPNRGWGCPIFVIILPIASLTCFAPTFGQFLFAISYRIVSISGTDELPGFA